MLNKIIYAHIYLLIFLSMELLFSGCANRNIITDNMKISVVVQKISAWVNLMPGISKEHSIHISGKFLINNIGDTEIQQLKLKSIKILQGNKESYFENFSFIANDTIAFVPESTKEFSVTAVTAINEKTKLNYNTVVKFEFFYSSFSKNYIDTVGNILIAKVY